MGERHEFLTLNEPYYDGLNHRGGTWYCACGRWHYSYGDKWGDKEVRKRAGKLEFLAHLDSLGASDE
jgi:hypothetical protein